MKKNISLSKDLRVKKYQNYEVLTNIREAITERIEKEYESETTALRAENENFYKIEKTFKDDVQKLLSSDEVSTITKLKVAVQVGKGGSVIDEYEGHLQREFKRNDSWFNFIDNNYNDGKPFTIAFSCLLSVEILD